MIDFAVVKLNNINKIINVSLRTVAVGIERRYGFTRE